jgi:hypothetical protein
MGIPVGAGLFPAAASVGYDEHLLYYALYTTHCALRTVHYTLYTMHCALHTVHYTLYTTHCALHTVHYPLYTNTLCTLTHYTLCTLTHYTGMMSAKKRIKASAPVRSTEDLKAFYQEDRVGRLYLARSVARGPCLAIVWSDQRTRRRSSLLHNLGGGST